MQPNFWGRLKTSINERGFFYTVKNYFFTILRLMKQDYFDPFVIWKNKGSLMSGNKLVDLPSHTIQENRRRWESDEWLEGGEQWVPKGQLAKGLDAIQWKNKMTNEFLLRYIKKDSVILEIGSGGGRWTEILQPLAKKLIVTDISPKCIKICKKRFELKNNLDYKLIDKRLDFIDDGVIDYVWSYAVFVHINPSDIDRYLEDFSRILNPGGFAIIHHCGTYSDYHGSVDGWKVFIGAKQFSKLVRKHGMEIVEQSTKLLRPGDVVSIFAKPSN